jgi:hypothetical protein
LCRDITNGEPTGSIHRTFIHADGTRVLEGDKPMAKKGLGAHGEHGMALIGEMPQEGPLLVDTLTGAAVMGLPGIATLGISRPALQQTSH